MTASTTMEAAISATSGITPIMIPLASILTTMSGEGALFRSAVVGVHHEAVLDTSSTEDLSARRLIGGDRNDLVDQSTSTNELGLDLTTCEALKENESLWRPDKDVPRIVDMAWLLCIIARPDGMEASLQKSWGSNSLASLINLPLIRSLLLANGSLDLSLHESMHTKAEYISCTPYYILPA